MSLAAAGLYVAVLFACLLAGATALRQRQQSWHFRNWAVIAVIFAGLAVMRWTGFEELLRDELRALLRGGVAYGQRQDVQRPLAAGVIGASLTLAYLWFYRAGRGVRGRRNLAVLIAGVSAAGLLSLLALRLISLHQIDKLLYSGPIRLNWLLDVGSSLAVLGAAAFYIWTVARDPNPRRRQR